MFFSRMTCGKLTEERFLFMYKLMKISSHYYSLPLAVFWRKIITKKGKATHKCALAFGVSVQLEFESGIMKLYLLPIFILGYLFQIGCSSPVKMENAYQHDADLARLEHLEYWTGLVEEYNNIKGSYPFQDTLVSADEIGLVKIATKQQKQYLSEGSSAYDKRLDNNSNGRFTELDISDLVLELERVLGREIVEKYDIQRVPTSSPVGYNYFYTRDGYLIWTTCLTCGVTKISTLLFDGYTPTVNIVSVGMKGKVTKALLREEMLAHKTYKQWVARSYGKEGFVRSVEKENSHDSKH